MMVPFAQKVVAAFALASLIYASGCSKNTATLSGRVTMRGVPLTSGSVVVFCGEQHICRGVIDTEGRYSIPDVPRGLCRVTVQTTNGIPTGLRNPQRLPPHVEAPAIPASVKPQEKGIAIPMRYTLPDESKLTVTIDNTDVTYDIDLQP
jgi:hypothetical protein